MGSSSLLGAYLSCEVLTEHEASTELPNIIVVLTSAITAGVNVRLR